MSKETVRTLGVDENMEKNILLLRLHRSSPSLPPFVRVSIPSISLLQEKSKSPSIYLTTSSLRAHGFRGSLLAAALKSPLINTSLRVRFVVPLIYRVVESKRLRFMQSDSLFLYAIVCG